MVHILGEDRSLWMVCIQKVIESKRLVKVQYFDNVLGEESIFQPIALPKGALDYVSWDSILREISGVFNEDLFCIQENV